MPCCNPLIKIFAGKFKRLINRSRLHTNMTKEKDSKLPPKKRAVSYEDCNTGLDLTKDATPQHTHLEHLSPKPAPLPAVPEYLAAQPASPASPKPLDLKVKSYRHNNASPPHSSTDSRFRQERKPYERPFSMDINSRQLFPISRDRDTNSPPRFPILRDRDTNSPPRFHILRDRDTNSPPRFPTSRDRDTNSPPRFPIKEEPEAMGESGAGDHRDIGENQVQIKTEIPTGIIGRGSPPRPSPIMWPISLEEMRMKQYLQAPNPLTLQGLNQIILLQDAMQSGRSHQQVPMIFPSGRPDLQPPHILLSQVNASTGIPVVDPSRIQSIWGRALRPEVSLQPVKPEARPPPVNMIFSPIQNHPDKQDDNRVQRKSPMENNFSNAAGILGRVNSNTDRASLDRESHDYDSDSDLDVGGTPEPPFRPSGFSKSKFIDEKNIHNYNMDRSSSIEMRKKNSKDLKRARDHGMDHLFTEIISLPMEEFQDLCQRENFTQEQQNLAREFRRRGKNKVAAQNCRKRKLEQVHTLEEQLEQRKKDGIKQDEKLENILTEESKLTNDVLQLFDTIKEKGGEIYCLQCNKSVPKENSDCSWMHRLSVRG